MRTVNKIVIHYTDTPPDRDVTVEDITRWHQEKEYITIGYHYYIDIQGKRHKGRPLEQVGAHVRGHNGDSIGIAFAGTKHPTEPNKSTMNDLQEWELVKLLSELREVWPDAEILGHRDLAATECPGFDVREWVRFGEGSPQIV
jgi:N-acetylmuramoyl-L-alanine amidase